VCATQTDRHSGLDRTRLAAGAWLAIRTPEA
jgi:hypothetical protein